MATSDDALRAKLNKLYYAEKKRLAALGNADRSLPGEYLSPVFGEGNCHSPKLLFIGEAPGREEAAAGRPFVGRAGKQLDRFFALAHISRQDVYITNAVKFRPVTPTVKSAKNRTPGRGEIIDGLPVLREELSLVRPQIVVTLGNTPLSALYFLCAQTPATIGAVHGRLLRLSSRPWLLYPMYHPASVIYRPQLMQVYEQDAVALGALLGDDTVLDLDIL